MDAGNTADESVIVDLSVAENWLIRDEILEIHQRVVQNNLHAEVSLSSCISFDGRIQIVMSLTIELGCGTIASVLA